MFMMLASGLGRVDTRAADAHDACEESRCGRADAHDARLGPGKSRHVELLMLMMLVKSRDAGGLMLMMLAADARESRRGRADAHDACLQPGKSRRVGVLMFMMLVKSRDAGGLMLLMLASGLGRVDTWGG